MLCTLKPNKRARVQEGSDKVRRSKLHLVDLAGSERIKRTGIAGGALLRESKHINLSLHFLEQVIVALQVRCTVHCQAQAAGDLLMLMC